MGTGVRCHTQPSNPTSGALAAACCLLPSTGVLRPPLLMFSDQVPQKGEPPLPSHALFAASPTCCCPQDGSVTMDMATAAFAWFGLLEAKAAGRPIPPDVAMNAAGLATTDPDEVLQGGAIRVFDRSYKVRLPCSRGGRVGLEGAGGQTKAVGAGRCRCWMLVALRGLGWESATGRSGGVPPAPRPPSLPTCRPPCLLDFLLPVSKPRSSPPGGVFVCLGL